MQMLPSERDPIAERDGRVSLPWRAWFDDLRRQVESDGGSASDVAADIEAICRALGSPDGTPENIPDDAGVGAVIGQGSIRSFGQLSDGRVLLTLANDADAPGPTYCYGTDALGDKGWFPISDALAASANITLTVGADGVTTPDLADLADSGTGTFRLLTRDGKGRLSGTADGTTDDVPEGAGNLYHTAQRVRDVVLDGLSTATNAAIAATDTVLSALGKLQAQITALGSTVSGLIVQTITEGDTTHAPSGDAVFDALAGKAPLLSPQFTGWVGIGKVADRPLTISSDSSTLPAGSAVLLLEGDGNKERIEARSSGGGDPTFQGKASQGSLASPLALTAGESLVTLAGSGHNGVDWQVGNKAIIRAAAAESWSGVGMGCYWAIATTENGTTSFAYRWRFDDAGHFTPWEDNAFTIGNAGARVKELFCANGIIFTSDAREKTEPRDLTAAELSCASDLARLPSIFQWLHAIAEKGEAARLHCSPTVQSVMAVMESHGLDPFRYGFVCYDEWDETPEVVESWEEERDDEGNVTREAGSEVTQEYRPADDRYSLRPSELAHFVMRGLAHRQDQLEARLAALESE